jgi:hypothetical protein
MDGNWCSGGGAGSPGKKGDNQPGGDGTNCWITGSEVWYAGGGGANASGPNGGGKGGGGGGPDVFGGPAYSGAPNTGGGGGGSWGGTGGNGGSGIVIIAYKVSAPPEPPTIPPGALVLDVQPGTGGAANITIPTVQGRQYRIKWTETLLNPAKDSVWTIVPAFNSSAPDYWVTGDGNPAIWIDSPLVPTRRFYILEVR